MDVAVAHVMNSPRPSLFSLLFYFRVNANQRATKKRVGRALTIVTNVQQSQHLPVEVAAAVHCQTSPQPARTTGPQDGQGDNL